MSSLSKNQLLYLLELRDRGLCSKEEEELLDKWFNEVPAIQDLTFSSEEEKEKIRTDISDAVFEQIKTGTDNDMHNGAGNNIPLPATRSKKIKWQITGMAAALLICCAAYAVYYVAEIRPTEHTITVNVPKGIEKLPVTLPDSSLVWLAGGSTLSFPEKFPGHHRDVVLSGTGYFSVTPDKEAPFTVNTNKAISVNVLGTSFIVDARAETQDVRISVLTGHVRINEHNRKLDVLLPQESLLYSCKDNTFSKLEQLGPDADEWRANSIIYLHNVSLQELSFLVHTMYHCRLVYNSSAQMARYRFNMSFPKDLSVDELLEMLTKISGLNFTRNGDEISIAG